MIVFVKRLMMLVLPLCAMGAALIPALAGVLPESGERLFEVCPLPCLGGVIAGKTPLDVADTMLLESFPTLTFIAPVEAGNTTPLMFTMQLGNRTVDGMITGTPLVRTVTIDGGYRLIELIEIFGTPNCIYHERIIRDVSTSVMVQWRFDADRITASAFIDINRENRWGAYTAVRSFRLSVSDVPCRSGRLQPREWRGFPLFWRFRFED